MLTSMLPDAGQASAAADPHVHAEAVARFVALQTILYPDSCALRWLAQEARKPAKAKVAKPKPDARAAFFAEVMRWGGARTGDPLVTLPAAWCREAKVAGVVIKSPRAIHVPAGMPLPANVELAPPPPARKSDAEWEAVMERFYGKDYVVRMAWDKKAAENKWLRVNREAYWVAMKRVADDRAQYLQRGMKSYLQMAIENVKRARLIRERLGGDV